MTINVQCPACGTRLKVGDEAAGKAGKCPDCGGPVQIPEAIYDAEDVAEDVGGGFDFPGIQSDTDEYRLAPEPAAPASSASSDSRRPCPMCGEMVVFSAAKCRFCGEVFDPMLKRRQVRTSGRSSDEDLDTIEWVICILCCGIGCIVGIVYMIQGKPKGGKMVLISICAGVIGNILNAVLQALVQQ